jgi:aryl-alcohol dehydrogenase-like predicted oxidoreductase
MINNYFMERTLIPFLNKSFSSIGLGCVTFGREIDQQASYSLMDYAVEKGITFFDTASAYGDGASEKIIGSWMADRHSASDSILVSTKVLPPYTPKKIIGSVDQSLKRLGTDAIDLLYLHRWDATIEDIDALQAFNDLIKMGKIKMLGVSNFNAEQIGKIIRLQKEYGFSLFRTIQNNNNFAVRDINKEVEQTCVDHDIKIVTYSPLGAGFLTGKYKNGVEDNTRFSLIKGHQDIYFNETSFQRLNKLQKVSAHTGYSSSHLALAWALHQPHVTSVLVGGRSREQLEQAFSALAFYDPDIFNELASV